MRRSNQVHIIDSSLDGPSGAEGLVIRCLGRIQVEREEEGQGSQMHAPDIITPGEPDANTTLIELHADSLQNIDMFRYQANDHRQEREKECGSNRCFEDCPSVTPQNVESAWFPSNYDRVGCLRLGQSL